MFKQFVRSLWTNKPLVTPEEKVDLGEPRPIEQDHEAKPEASYTPDPTPKVVVKEVPAAPTSSPPTPTPSSTAAAPSPKPGLEKEEPPSSEAQSDVNKQLKGSVAWVVALSGFIWILSALVRNLDGVLWGNYWGVMNVVAASLVVWGGVTLGRKWYPLPPGMQRKLLYGIGAVGSLWVALGIFIIIVGFFTDAPPEFFIILPLLMVPGVVIALLCRRALRK
jgi:hypothetical protein